MDDDFEPGVAEGPIAKRKMDSALVKQRERLVTRGWQRLREVQSSETAIIHYPLAEVRDQIRARYD